MPTRRLPLATALLCAALALPAGAAEPAQALPALTLPDQHGASHTLGGAVKRIYYTRDMAGGKLMKAVLVERAAERLQAQGAIAVSDVSGMPGPIRSMMALPALKKRPYPVWVDERGQTAALLPHQPDSVAVIELDALRITGVRHLSSEAELRALLPELPAP